MITLTSAAGTPYASSVKPGHIHVTSAGLQQVIKSNLSASSAPAVTDDSDSNYSVGSVWINTTSDISYVCVDAAAGAAVWKDVSSSTAPAGVGTELQYRSSSASFGAVTGSSFSGGIVGLPTTVINSASNSLRLTNTSLGTKDLAFYIDGSSAWIYSTNTQQLNLANGPNSNNIKIAIDSNGLVAINKQSAFGAQLHVVAGSSSTIGQIIDLASGQTADALQINSYGQTGGDLLRVTKDGTIRAKDAGSLTGVASLAGLSGSSYLLIGGTSPILSTHPSIAISASYLQFYSGSNSIYFDTSTTGSVIVRGANGQSADLFQANPYGVTAGTRARVTSAGEWAGNFSSSSVGFNTTAPDKQVEINSATGDCLRLTENDPNGSATNYTDFKVGNVYLQGNYYDIPGSLSIRSSANYINLGQGLTVGGGTGYETNIYTYGPIRWGPPAPASYGPGVCAVCYTSNMSTGLWFDGSTGLGLSANGTNAFQIQPDGKAGFLTSLPAKQVEINSATGDCLRLTYNDSNGSATNYADFTVNSLGNPIITPSGTGLYLGADKSLYLSSGSGVGFNVCTLKYNELTFNANAVISANASWLYVSNPWMLMPVYMGPSNYNPYINAFTTTVATFNVQGDDVDFVVKGATDDNLFLCDAGTDKVCIGTATPAAKTTIQSTTEQLRLGYDATNYTSFTTSSGGNLTITPSGGRTTVPQLLVGPATVVGNNTSAMQMLTINDSTGYNILSLTNNGQTVLGIGDYRWATQPAIINFQSGYCHVGHFAAGASPFEIKTYGQDIKLVPNGLGGSGGLVKIVNGSGNASFDVSSGGNLTITPSGGTTTLESGVIINDTGADRDTRIEGDTDPYLTVWDAGTDQVLIGTATTATGMKMRVAGSVQLDNKVVTPNSGALTIATGAITVTGAHHTIDTEAAAAADDLDTINGGKDGERVILRLVNAARVVTLKHGTGNIYAKSAADYSFTSDDEYVELLCVGGSTWIFNY